jgi:MFS transporter, NNP family, nitrate/nitrite transporter
MLATIGAVVKTDNLSVNSNAKGAIREVSRHSQTWIMSLLYIGTFGSFIGFGFAFGQVLLVRFPEQFPQPVKAAALTFLGPLLGSLIRPFGGALADRFKGSVVTSFNFLAMAFGALVVLGASQINSLPLFIVGFVMLFIFSGIGNGSTYKMIPASFTPRRSLRWALDSICWRLIAAPFPSWCLDWVGWGDRRARRCDGQPGLPAVLPDAAER